MRWNWKDIISAEAIRRHDAWLGEPGSNGEKVRIDLVDEDLTDLQVQSMDRARFRRCVLRNGIISMAKGLEATSCRFDGSLLSLFDGARITKSTAGSTRGSHSFDDADLQDCIFADGELGRADFCKAHLSQLEFANNVMGGSHYRGGCVTDSRFRACDLGTRQGSTSLTEGALFRRCDFSGSDFGNREFNDAIFEHCIFDGTRGSSVVTHECTVIAPVCEGEEPAWFAKATVVRAGETVPAEVRDRLALIDRTSYPVKARAAAGFPSWWSILSPKKLAAHREWLAGGDDRDPNDPRRLSVAGEDLTGALISGADLSGMKLEKCNLSDAVLGAAQSVEASECRFDGATIMGMGHSNLSDCTFEGSQMVVADFDGSRMTGCRFSAIEGLVSFREATLEECDFEGVTLTDADFVKATVRLSNFRDAKIDERNLQYANAVFAQFIECDLRGAHFGERELSSVTFEDCDLSGTTGEPWTKAGSFHDFRDDETHPVDATQLIRPKTTGPEPDWFKGCTIVR